MEHATEPPAGIPLLQAIWLTTEAVQITRNSIHICLKFEWLLGIKMGSKMVVVNSQ